MPAVPIRTSTTAMNNAARRRMFDCLTPSSAGQCSRRSWHRETLKLAWSALAGLESPALRRNMWRVIVPKLESEGAFDDPAHTPAVRSGRDDGHCGGALWQVACSRLQRRRPLPPSGDRALVSSCTVRDLLEADYEGTLAKVADMGITWKLSRRATTTCPRRIFGRCSTRLQLTMPSTHARARGRRGSREAARWLPGDGHQVHEIAAAGQRGAGPAAPDRSAACDHSAGRVSTTPVPDESATPSRKPRPSGPYQTAGDARVEQAARRTAQLGRQDCPEGAA